MLEHRVHTLQNERDSLQANFLLQKQIIENEKDKESDMGGIWKDEIEDIKESFKQGESQGIRLITFIKCNRKSFYARKSWNC